MSGQSNPNQEFAAACMKSKMRSRLPEQVDAAWFLAGRLSPSGPLQYVPVDAVPFTIGRKPDSALRLSSARVSSTHAELIRQGRDLILRDPGSTNGTFVNGERISEPVPLCPDDLVQFADVPFRVMQQRVQPSAMTAHDNLIDQAVVLVLFDRLMNEQAVIPHYQPIIDLHDGGVIAFEALARSNICELHTPDAMFSAAAQLGLEAELSQMMRFKAIQETASFQSPPHMFLNTHPHELGRVELIESMKALRALRHSQRITLEIHEKAITDCSEMKRLQAHLQDLDIDLAFDDFGAGQARIVELIDVHPKYLKFDMSLIRQIHLASEERQRLVASLVQMAHDVGAIPLAEGVECDAEREACVQLGFELAQGFLFGRPVPLNPMATSLTRPGETTPYFELQSVLSSGD